MDLIPQATVAQDMSPASTDPFRSGYETVRLELYPAWYSDDQMRESYDRGVAFAKTCASTGYVLEAWPAGDMQPPRRAARAFRIATGGHKSQPVDDDKAERPKITWAPSDS